MLKGYYNFSGFVVVRAGLLGVQSCYKHATDIWLYTAQSDWGATHSTSAAINAGLDIDMPDNTWFNQKSIHGEQYRGQRYVLG